MAKISPQEVLDIARISNVDVHQDEVEPLVHQLEQVLSYAERVKEVGNVQALTSKNKNILREDCVGASNPSVLLAQAPEREGDFFVVPLILEGSDSKKG